MDSVSSTIVRVAELGERVRRPFAIAICLWLVLGSVLAQWVPDKSPDNAKVNRERGLAMLSDVKENLKEQYYDPTFHGVNIDERFRAAQEQIKRGDTNGQIFRVIAQAVLDLDDLVACKLYTFMIEPGVVDKMMKEVTGHKKLILDLRGNGGGALETEMRLIGYFFDHDVKIATEVRKNKRKDRIARSRKDRAFAGQLVVLVDSNSASASEIIARVIQIEKRGEIIGDVTAGKVMEGVFLNLRSFRGVGALSVFGLEVTIADLVMSDGQRLEGAGVVPDKVLVPTNRALVEKTDPLLAYAVSAFGVRLSAEDAGKYYFIRPVPEPGEEPGTSSTPAK